jgi:hypothetical protein
MKVAVRERGLRRIQIGWRSAKAMDCAEELSGEWPTRAY